MSGYVLKQLCMSLQVPGSELLTIKYRYTASDAFFEALWEVGCPHLHTRLTLEQLFDPACKTS